MYILRNGSVARTGWRLSVVVLLVLGWAFLSHVASCSTTPANNEKGPVDGGTTEKPATDVKKIEVRGSSSTNILDPGKRGPYQVGVTTWRLTDPTRKDVKTGEPLPMVVEIWYPAVDSAKDTPKDAYDVSKDAPKATVDEIKKLDVKIPLLGQEAHRDVELLKSEGRFPLILYSHGSGGIRYQSVFQTTHLASHGYVVVSVDHHGNTLYDLVVDREKSMNDVPRFATSRPIDVKFLYDLMKTRVKDPKDRFFEMIDVVQVGITGHSYGGLTSILATKEIPELKVSIPQTPFTFSGYGGVKAEYIAKVPVMVMGSDQDKTLDFQKEQRGFYDNLITKPEFFEAERHMVTLKKGGHFSYSNICDFDLSAVAVKLGMGNSVTKILSDGCSKTDNTPIEEAHRLINYYSTALFNVILRKSEKTREYLKQIDSPHIAYESKKP